MLVCRKWGNLILFIHTLPWLLCTWCYKGKAALLIGCNYEGQRNDLRGCVNDVLEMREMLVERFSFDDDQIVLLSDGDAEVYVMSHSVVWQ